jgi:multisubunit Na+/H+ antiporter MnhB subunit
MRKAILFVAFLFVSAFLLLAVSDLRPFGAPQIATMDDYFIANTQSQVAVNNVVTAVVFDYRGFDTLGEATVLFAAVVGILSLFRRLREDEL